MIPIGNFGVVVPGKLYRGAQPMDGAFAGLKGGFGINTVIDLREPFGRFDESFDCEALGIAHHNIAIGATGLSFGIEPPTGMQLAQIFDLIADPDNVCFVHCEHGEDRTGAVIAAYRMSVDRWTNAQAMAEAEEFHISPLQVLIRAWISDYRARDYKAA